VQVESANMASSSSSSDEGSADDFDNYNGGGLVGNNKIVPVDEQSLRDKEYIANLRRDLTSTDAREEWMRALGQEHFPLK